MTGNRNANKKEVDEGEMQIASVSRKKITSNTKSTLRPLTDILNHNNYNPNRFAKKKLFSCFCQ